MKKNISIIYMRIIWGETIKLIFSKIGDFGETIKLIFSKIGDFLTSMTKYNNTIGLRILWNVILLLIFYVVNSLLLILHDDEFFNQKEKHTKSEMCQKDVHEECINLEYKQWTTGEILYFTMITHFTVGYGDYFPTTILGKVFTAIHVFLAYMLNIFNIIDTDMIAKAINHKYSLSVNTKTPMTETPTMGPKSTKFSFNT